MKKNVIIIGSRGYGQNYGGWETFTTNLIDNYPPENINFFVPELTNQKKLHKKHKTKNNVKCTSIYTGQKGSAKMLIFVAKAVCYYRNFIKQENLENVIIYILGSRVGPLFTFLKKSFQKKGVTIIFNPDGIEWQRSKWNYFVKKYLKYSEKKMIQAADHVVCDSKSIKKYIDAEYNITSTFIAYGTYIPSKAPKDNNILKKYQLKTDNYYLIIARFVSENNFALIVKEYMKSNSKKDLVIITNLEENKFYNHLLTTTNFKDDSRIKFLKPIYDQTIVKTIRINAYANIHGHSVGGTNPTLLEALAHTKLHLVYNVSYNKEVCSNATLYFNQKPSNLKNQLEKLDKLPAKEVKNYQAKALKRIKENYTWGIVVEKYQKLFHALKN